jgi:small subunit ribosomal protein S2
MNLPIEEIKKEQKFLPEEDFNISEMIKSGVHLGKKRSASHAKMNPYVFSVKNDIQIIDLDKTAEKLSIASGFLKNTLQNGGVILFVGTRAQLKNLVKNAAISCNMPYVTERWLGGTLTNWSEISKRLNYFLDLESKKDSGKLAKYTKHEQLKLSNQLEKLSVLFNGIRTLKNIPDVVFVIDAASHIATLLEAKKLNIPVVAIADTDTDPELVNYIIPANSSSISSVKLILDKICQTVNPVNLTS